MDNINFNDYKIVVFEDGKPVFFGENTKDNTHGELITEYINQKLNSDEFKSHPQLNQLKNCNASVAMAGQVLFFTNAVFVLNIGIGSYIMFKEGCDNKDLQIIKDYSGKIEDLGTPYLFQVGVVKDDEGPLYIQDQMIEDDLKAPLVDRIDYYLNETRGRGR